MPSIWDEIEAEASDVPHGNIWDVLEQEYSKPLQFREPNQPPLFPQESTTAGGPPKSFAPAGAVASELSEEAGEYVKRAPEPTVHLPTAEVKESDDPLLVVGKETYNILKSVPEFLSSPLGASSIVAAKGAPGTVSAIFTGDMLRTLGQQVKGAVQNWDKLSRNQQISAVVQMAGTGLFAGLLGKHTLKEVDRNFFPSEYTRKYGAQELAEQIDRAKFVPPNLISQPELRIEGTRPEPSAVSVEPTVRTPERPAPKDIWDEVEEQVLREALASEQIKPPVSVPVQEAPQSAVPTTAEVSSAKPVAAPTVTEPSAISETRPTPDITQTESVRTTDITPSAEPALAGMGGAIASEFARQGPATAMKFRAIDADRQRRGLPPLPKPESVTDQVTFDKAQARLDQDPSFGDRLVTELNQNPRAIQAWENHVLAIKEIEARHEYDKATREAFQAYEDSAAFPERAEQMRDAEFRATEWSNKLTEIEKASRLSGSERGRALRALQVMVNEDFSLATLERNKRVDNVMRPLTIDERAQLKKISDDHAALQEKLAKMDAEKAKVEQEIVVEQTKALEKPDPYVIRIAERIVKSLDTRADAARQRLRERMGRMSSGIDPTILADLAEIGASHIVHVGLDFAKWSDRMIKDLGDWVKPHLKDAFESSKKVVDNMAEASTLKKDKAPAVKRTIKKTVPTATEALEAFKNRTRKQIGVFEEKIAKGDVAQKQRKRLDELDDEAVDLEFQLDKLKQRVQEMRAADQRKNASTASKVAGELVEGAGLVRSVLTSFEASAVLRQGKIPFMAGPWRSIGLGRAMIEAAGSERGAFRRLRMIKHRQNYKNGYYQLGKLFIAEKGGGLNKLEEAFASRIASKIPGIGASERAYTAYLNELRADLFDSMVKTMTKNGKDATPQELRTIGDYVNAATGRGTFFKDHNPGVLMQHAFFSPRFVASRFNYLFGQPFYKASSARAKVAIAKEYARTLTGYAIFYTTMAYLAEQVPSYGISIEKNPTSSDFGKIRIGNTRIDPLAGLQQVTRFVVNESGVTEREKKIGGGTKKIDPLATATRFLRTKLAPIPSLIVDWKTGSDVVGNKFKYSDIPRKMLVPITYQDTLNIMRANGVPLGTALMVLAFFGEGVNEYEPRNK